MHARFFREIFFREKTKHGQLNDTVGSSVFDFLQISRGRAGACALLRALLGAEEDGGFAGEERRGGPAANIWDPGGAIPKPAGGR